MATRRITSQEKTHLDQDETRQEGKSIITPAVPPKTIFLLLVFTFAMITLPIGSYFLSVNFLFSGNATYAGALAAVVANIVLIGWVVTAFAEDQGEQNQGAVGEGKKAQ